MSLEDERWTYSFNLRRPMAVVFALTVSSSRSRKILMSATVRSWKGRRILVESFINSNMSFTVSIVIAPEERRSLTKSWYFWSSSSKTVWVGCATTALARCWSKLLGEQISNQMRYSKADVIHFHFVPDPCTRQMLSRFLCQLVPLLTTSVKQGER